MSDNKIDTSDIPEILDFTNARPNPFAESIKQNGYSITIHYSQDDVARMTQNALEIAQNLDMLELDPDELAALKKYQDANCV